MNKKIVLLLCILLFINLISGVSTVINQQFTEGFALKIPYDNHIKFGSDFEIEVHVFNISSGYPRDIGLGCYLHLYNKSGRHILEMYDDTVSHNFDYSFLIKANNFTEIGTYNYVVQCNSSKLGGYVEDYLIVTKDGSEFVYSKEMFIITLLVLSIILLMTGLSFNNEKYLLKSGLIILSILVCILAINSVYSFIPDSSILNLMGISVLIIFIALFILLILYLFIIWTIETLKSVKQKEGVRWQY